LAATYGYWLATAGPQEARWLAHEMNARFKVRVVRQVQAAITQTTAGQATQPHLRRVLDFMLDRHTVALDSLTRLGRLDVQPFKTEAQTFAESEWARCKDIVGEPPAAPADLPDDVAHQVPRRAFPAQVSERPYVRRLSEADREALWAYNKKHGYAGQVAQTVAMYWADGKRTLAQIVDYVELETGQRNAAMLAEFFQWMEKMGLVTITNT
jgi:hypothetical protein